MSLGRRILLSPPTRLVIAAVLFVVLAAPLFAVIALSTGARLEIDLRVLELVGELYLGAAALGTLVIIGGAVELRRPAEFGLPWRGLGRCLALGFGVGTLVFTGVVAVLAAPGWYRVVGFNLGSTALGEFAYFVALFFWVAVLEEVFFRGILFRILEEGIGSWAALIVSGLAFGLGHVSNPGASPWSGIAIAISAGPLLTAAYMLTRSLWFPIGIHWAWNLFEGPVYGLGVSGLKTETLIRSQTHGPALWTGSAFGPEDGIAAVGVALAAAVAMLILAARRGQVVTPDWMRRLLPQRSPS